MSTNLREVVLGLLWDRPNHAYALKRLIAPRVSKSEFVNDGILYPMLTKLEKDGLIRGRQEIGPSKRKRTIYTVTASGRRELMSWLESKRDEGDEPTYDFFLGNPFLVKVQFFQRLPEKDVSLKLQGNLAETDEKLKHFAEIRKGMNERQVDPFRIALLDLGIAQQKARRRWLRGLLAERKAKT